MENEIEIVEAETTENEAVEAETTKNEAVEAEAAENEAGESESQQTTWTGESPVENEEVSVFEDRKHIPVFPTNLFEFSVKDLDGLNESLAAGLSQIDNSSGLPNWSSVNNLHLSDDFASLAANIMSAVAESFNFLKYNYNELAITSLSAHTVTQPDRSPPETFSNNILSGFYFMKTGGGKVVLSDPRSQAWSIRPSIDEIGVFNSDVFVLEMVEGNVLVMPAWLQRFTVFPEGQTGENVYFTWSAMIKN